MRTRTYADILARQGQLPEAIDIYRSLLQKKPNDPALHKRVAALEAELAGMPAPAPEAAPDLAPEPEPAPAPSPGTPRPIPLPTPRPSTSTSTSTRRAVLEKLLYRIQARRRR